MNPTQCSIKRVLLLILPPPPNPVPLQASPKGGSHVQIVFGLTLLVHVSDVTLTMGSRREVVVVGRGQTLSRATPYSPVLPESSNCV